MLSFPKENLTLDPYPHVHSRQVLDPALYRELLNEFPDGPLMDKRSGKFQGGRRRLQSSEDDFNGFLEHAPAWKRFYSHLNSRAFADQAFQLFAPAMRKDGCIVDPVSYRFDPTHFFNSRHPGAAARLVSRLPLGPKFTRFAEGTADRIFSRDVHLSLDLSSSEAGYEVGVHTDRGHRIAVMLIYFCDAADAGMKGGHLTVDRAKPGVRITERFPPSSQTERVSEIPPTHNTGILFLSNPASLHGVTKITETRDPRRFLYAGLSIRGPEAWANGSA